MIWPDQNLGLWLLAAHGKCLCNVSVRHEKNVTAALEKCDGPRTLRSRSQQSGGGGLAGSVKQSRCARVCARCLRRLNPTGRVLWGFCAAAQLFDFVAL